MLITMSYICKIVSGAMLLYSSVFILYNKPFDYMPNNIFCHCTDIQSVTFAPMKPRMPGEILAVTDLRLFVVVYSRCIAIAVFLIYKLLIDFSPE